MTRAQAKQQFGRTTLQQAAAVASAANAIKNNVSTVARPNVK